MRIQTDVVSLYSPFGLNRLFFARQDLGSPVLTDAENAMACAGDIWQAASTYMPTTATLTGQAAVDVLDSATAQILSTLVVPSPFSYGGQSSSAWVAGTGARLAMTTSTVLGRRYMRAATQLVPLTIAAFNSSGLVNTSSKAAMLAGFTAALNHASLTNLLLVSWHRPTDALPSSGSIGPVTGGSIDNLPSFLARRKNG